MKSIVLGGGCFWCLEAYFSALRGVIRVVPGYAGGTSTNPTYEFVCNEIGGHAEVVQIDYDETVLPFSTLLTVFWTIHDPTTPNRQGHDQGIQYRSCAYYSDPADYAVLCRTKERMQSKWDDPIVTEILPLVQFFEAEDYHHNYFAKNPEKAYCVVVINPRLVALRREFANLLR